MATNKQTAPRFINGTAKSRATSTDYMAALLESVSLDDWRDVVTGAVKAAKEGDSQARAWLAQYILGRPEHKAPTPINVVVQQLQGRNDVIERLTSSAKFGLNFPDDDQELAIRRVVTAELACLPD